MHTVIRHQETPNGFIIVVSGRANEQTFVQQYTVHKTQRVTLDREWPYSDERFAIRVFDEITGQDTL